MQKQKKKENFDNRRENVHRVRGVGVTERWLGLGQARAIDAAGIRCYRE